MSPMQDRPRCPSCGSGDTIADEVCVGPRIDDWSTGWTCRQCGADSRDLLAICVLEVMDGRPPEIFVRARLEIGANGVELQLHAPGSGSVRRLPLAAQPVGGIGGIGLRAVWLASRPGEAVPVETPILVRPLLQSDASWLSHLGVEARPTREILEDIVRLRDGYRPPDEELAILHLPRLRPHALGYRIRSRVGEVIWIWANEGWRRAEDSVTASNPRLIAIAMDAQQFPWTRRNVRSVRSLLKPGLPGLTIRPEHLLRAGGRMCREPRQHDMIAFMMMGASPETTVTDEDLGEDLAMLLVEIGASVQAAYEARYGENPWDHEAIMEEDPGSGTFPTGVFNLTWEAARDAEVASLRQRPFAMTAGQLIRLLNHYDEREDELLEMLSSARGGNA